MRAFWALFFHGLLFMAPMVIYFTAFLFFMDHVIRSSGTQATIADIGSMATVLLLLPLIARAIKHSGSRTSLWVAAVPYIGGFTLLLLVATQGYQVPGCYILIKIGRAHVCTPATWPSRMT